MNTNAYKAAIHKVHDRTIYEPSNALPFYAKDCGGGWVCFESRHKDWRFYYLSINTRYTEPEVVMEWSLNPSVVSSLTNNTTWSMTLVYHKPILQKLLTNSLRAIKTQLQS